MIRVWFYNKWYQWKEEFILQHLVFWHQILIIITNDDFETFFFQENGSIVISR